MNKKLVFLLFCLTIISPCFCDAGLYLGGSVNTAFYQARHWGTYGDDTLDKTTSREGFGFSASSGWTFKKGLWSLGPEIGISLNNGSYSKEWSGILGTGSADTAVMGYKRPLDASLSFVAGRSIGNGYQILGLAGINVAQFKYTIKEVYAPSPQKITKRKSGVGVSFGLGVEKDFSNWSLGLIGKYTLYNKRSINFIDPDNVLWASAFKPRILQFDIRVKVPLYSKNN